MAPTGPTSSVNFATLSSVSESYNCALVRTVKSCMPWMSFARAKIPSSISPNIPIFQEESPGYEAKLNWFSDISPVSALERGVVSIGHYVLVGSPRRGVHSALHGSKSSIQGRIVA